MPPMSKKPQDMLEFLRRNREELARALPPPPLPQNGEPRPKKPPSRPPDGQMRATEGVAARKPRPRPPEAPAKPAPRKPSRPAGSAEGGRSAERGGAGRPQPSRRPAAPPPPRAPGGAALPTITVPVRTAWMAGGGAAIVVLIAFWTGMKLGGGPALPDNARLATPGGPDAVWTVRVATFDADEQARAESVVDAIRTHRAARGMTPFDVVIRPLTQDGKLVVTIGSWPGDPKDDAQAGEVLEYVRRLQNKETGRPLFEEAYFWQTPR